MKYSKYIVFFLFINFIIVFLSIFTGNLTRKLEITNQSIKQEIIQHKEQLSINKIELSYYNNSDYLKKLHNIYFSLEEKNLENKIVSLSNYTKTKEDNLVLVNFKSK